MNAKDRRDYRRHQAALLKHINRARNAVAELDAITHGEKPSMHNSNVRDLRELLGVTYSMALSTRLELWDALVLAVSWDDLHTAANQPKKP